MRLEGIQQCQEVNRSWGDRSSGHGSSGPSVTPRNQRNVDPQGNVRYGNGPDRSATNKDMREIARDWSDPPTGSHIRARGGR